MYIRRRGKLRDKWCASKGSDIKYFDLGNNR